MLTYDFVAHRHLRWRLTALAMAIPAGWYLFAIFYYGSPFPATLGAKVAQGEFNWLGQRFLDGLLAFWEKWTRAEDHYALYLFPLLMAVGLIPVIRAERPWLIIIGRDVLYVTAFVTLSVPFADWYYAPLTPGIALLTARGVQFVAEGMVNITSRIASSNQSSSQSSSPFRVPSSHAVHSSFIRGLMLRSSLLKCKPASGRRSRTAM